MVRSSPTLLLALSQLLVAAARRESVDVSSALEAVEARHATEAMRATEATHATEASHGTEATNATTVAAPCGYRVFTDVDDTMVCSEGAMLHGIDSNCEKKGTIYPGMAAFFWYISVEKSGCTDPAKVVPLSARPKEFESFIGMKPNDPTNMMLAEVGKKRGKADWGLDLDRPIYGKASTALDVGNFNFESSLSPNKWEGWKSWASKLPTIFVGDNGQGDVYAAEMMVDTTTKGDGPELVAAFIHHVQNAYSPADQRLRSSVYSKRPGSRMALERKAIFLFQTYAEAACLAFVANIISADGYTEVMKNILAECAPDGFKTQACKVNIPEFGLTGLGGEGKEQLHVRPAQLCYQPRDTQQTAKEFNLLPPALMWAGGLPSIGLCEDVSDEMLQQIAAVRQHVKNLPLPGDASYDKGEFYMKNGVTTLVLHAARHGFHCVTRCGYTCKKEQSDWSHDGSSLAGTGEHLDYSCEGSIMGNVGHAFANMASGHRGRKVCRIDIA